MKKEFTIVHLDPLGQGVSKENEITFIKKTLPGEVVEAEIFSKKKGVQFAQLLEIKKAAPNRIAAECVHYEKCNGCDYQHTDYESELQFKKEALKRHLFKFPEIEIGLHAAPKRLNYRNRIQLHYDLKKRKLGLLNHKHEIIEVPDCKVINPSVAYELRNLYEKSNWMKLLSKQSVTGHIEIYWHNKDNTPGHNVHVSVNRPYANGGFTQVFPEMNLKLNDWLTKKACEIIPPKSVVYDLFGGNGNLTAKIPLTTVVIDQYKTTPLDKNHQRFISQNLYDENAIKNLIALKESNVPRPNWMIFDPPRSGLKNIKDFLNEFKPEGFIFIACDPTSFARDLRDVLDQYELVNLELFDLFPSTQHFETVGIFTRRTNRV